MQRQRSPIPVSGQDRPAPLRDGLAERRGPCPGRSGRTDDAGAFVFATQLVNQPAGALGWDVAVKAGGDVKGRPWVVTRRQHGADGPAQRGEVLRGSTWRR